jgi:SAM-dependent methyltransferase
VERFRDLVAVEPDPGMRRLHAVRCPGVRLLEASADALPIARGAADAVFVAEAFHLFPDEAVSELARVLRPGGTLALLWNVPAAPTEPSIAAAEQFLAGQAPDREALGYDPLDLNTRRFESGAWREAFAGSAFGPFLHRAFANPQTVDRDGLVAFFASMGWLSELSDAERMPLLDALRSLLDPAQYERHWTAHLYVAERSAYP